MRFYQTRQLQMLQNVAALLKLHHEKLRAKVPALGDVITDYLESIEYLRKLKQGNVYAVAISAGHKRTAKGEFIEHLLKLQSAITASTHRPKAKVHLRKPASHSNEMVLQRPAAMAGDGDEAKTEKAMSRSFSDLNRAKADELCTIGERIITATKKIKNIRYYGLTMEDIKDAQAYYDEYASLKNAPKLRKKEAATRNEDLALGTKEAIAILETNIDPLMHIATEGNAELRRRYKGFRIVLPRGQGRITEKEEKYRKSRKKKRVGKK